MRPSVSMVSLAILKKICLFEEIRFNSNAKNSIQIIFISFNYSYTYMQLNLDYYSGSLSTCANILCFVYFKKMLNNLLTSFESHLSIKIFEIYLKINF